MKKRQSNIELLRIISMLFILIVHYDGAALGLPYLSTPSALADFGIFSKISIEAISIIGVNCFILISGYFGIRASLKGLITFITWCLFYSVAIYIGKSIITPNYFNIVDFGKSFLILSHTDLWFIPAYFGLYILSPIINGGIEKISQHQFSWTLIGVIFINIYLGWWCDGKVNPTGYNIMQLIMIYMIGRHIGIFLSKHEISKSSSPAIAFGTLYILSTALIIASALFLPSGKAFAYNSPFVISASIAFFFIFTTFSLSSNVINYIASSAFAVYLIHKAPILWIEQKSIIQAWAVEHNYLEFTILIITMIIIVFLASIAIDKIREKITTPFVTYILSLFNKA